MKKDAECEICHTEAQQFIFRGLHCWTKSGQIVSKKGSVCKLCRVRRGQGGREGEKQHFIFLVMRFKWCLS